MIYYKRWRGRVRNNPKCPTIRKWFKIPLYINMTDYHIAIKNDNYSYKKMPI